MNSRFSLTSALFILIIFQLLFLGYFLFTRKKGKLISNRLLGWFFLLIAGNLLDVFLLGTGFYFSFPLLAGWGSCLPLLFGPLLYLYTRSILYRDFALSKRTFVHFIPFLVLFVVTEIYYFALPADTRDHMLRDIANQRFPKAISVVSILIFGQFFLYALASLVQVSRYKKVASQFFSDRRQTDLSWLNNALVFFTGIMVFAALNSILTQIVPAKYYLLAFNIIMVLLLVFISQVLLKELQAISGVLPEGDGAELGRAKNEEGVDAADPEKEKTMQRVLAHMQSRKPYLESELTLEELAAQLSLRPKVLSQTINEIQGQNFFDFINRYRIDEAKRLLTHPKDPKTTILEVLYEVGFNSKSSFNTLFKKYTGLTPSEFKKNPVP